MPAVLDRVSGGDEEVVGARPARLAPDEEGRGRVVVGASLADESVDGRPGGAHGRREVVGEEAFSGKTGAGAAREQECRQNRSARATCDGTRIDGRRQMQH